MRESTPPVSCLADTSKGKLTVLEAALAERDWQPFGHELRAEWLMAEGLSTSHLSHLPRAKAPVPETPRATLYPAQRS